jgi:hypothetical protein
MLEKESVFQHARRHNHQGEKYQPMILYRSLCIVVFASIALFSTVDSSFAKTRRGKAVYHLRTERMVTASRYEPHGSILKVTNPETGKSVIVTVNDRGPFNGNRILDLSTGAFKKLYGGLRRGIGPVHYTVIRRGRG